MSNFKSGDAMKLICSVDFFIPDEKKKIKKIETHFNSIGKKYKNNGVEAVITMLLLYKKLGLLSKSRLNKLNKLKKLLED